MSAEALSFRPFEAVFSVTVVNAVCAGFATAVILAVLHVGEQRAAAG
ncbi:MAG TPA: hypothetical protein VGJ34_06595 [Gaiellaceae bacterium]